MKYYLIYIMFWKHTNENNANWEIFLPNLIHVQEFYEMHLIIKNMNTKDTVDLLQAQAVTIDQFHCNKTR